MRIANHRLVDDEGSAIPIVESPNVGGPLEPEFIVIHYTALNGVEEAVKLLCDPLKEVSAHLIVGRAGDITQLVPFDRIARHAGDSQWGDRVRLNGFSIGIELDNPGRLEASEDGWKSWSGTVYPDSEVLIATHRHDPPTLPPCGWHRFSEDQIAATLEVCRVLVARYGIREILGHDDIAPGRKSDPGPAFPMDGLRRKLFQTPSGS